nr:putative odorant-binding protein A10 isoform X2 [Halyomorpha halys]
MFIAAALAILLSATLTPSFGDDQEDIYKKIFDDVDIDGILNNDRILDTYLRCFFNSGPCSNLADTIRGKIPEVFSTVCGLCTEKQKGLFKHSLDIFIPKRPDDWKHILEIYDPDGSYWPKIKEFLETY